MDDLPIGTESRRTLVKRAAWLAAAAIVPLFVAARAAIAAKLSRADVKYQDKPNAGKDCDDCIQFIPGKAEPTGRYQGGDAERTPSALRHVTAAG